MLNFHGVLIFPLISAVYRSPAKFRRANYFANTKVAFTANTLLHEVGDFLAWEGKEFDVLITLGTCSYK